MTNFLAKVVGPLSTATEPNEPGELVVVIEARAPLSLQDLREVWEFRSLLRRLASRDVTLRYRQTALGVVWVVLQPLLAAGIFGLVFGRIAKLPSSGLPYFVLSFAGMLGWQLYSTSLAKINSSLVGNAALVSKVFFPRLILPLSTIAGSFLDFCVAFTMLLGLLIVYGIALTSAIFWLPLAIAMLLGLAVGAGLGLAALTVRYRDVSYIVPVAIQFLLYASPVAYTLAAVPPSLRVYFQLNPLTGPLELIRHSTLATPAPGGGSLAYSAATACVLLVGGYLIFKNQERRFADVI